jgi:hypothetical protein
LRRQPLLVGGVTTFLSTVGPMSKASKVSKVVVVGTSGCCSVDDGTGDYKDEQRTPIFLALRAFGCILVTLSVFEFGVAGAAANITLENARGFWGAGVLSIVAGFLAVFPRNRGNVIAAIVIGTFAVILAIFGASADGASHDAVARVKACSSQSSYGSSINDYGSQDHFSDSRRCLANVGTNVTPDRCYCTATGGFFSFFPDCDDYDISPSARSTGLNCEVIFTSYPSLLEGSVALNALISIFSFVMTILACVVTCKKRDSLTIEETTPGVGLAGNDV